MDSSALQGLAQVGARLAAQSFFKQSENLVDSTPYRCSPLIEELVKQKHGESVFVVGSTLEELRSFWRHVGYKAEGGISEPQPVAKTVVDVDCKCHANYANSEGAGEDEFDITSKAAKDESMQKGYSLQTSEKHDFSIGGNGGLSASSAFFNLAGGGVKPELGINASFSSEKSRVESEDRSRDSKLSQAYEIVDKLHVPPRKQVKAKITTYAVTYEAKTTLLYSVDAKITLPVRYRNYLFRCLGGFFDSTSYLPAKEIFRNETGFRVDGDSITFTREGTVSYISEQVEIKKDKKDL